MIDARLLYRGANILGPTWIDQWMSWTSKFPYVVGV